MIATVEKVGTATTTHIIHTDHLGGTNVVTDANGDVAQTLDYYPYGSLRLNQQNGNFDERRKYIGEHYDAEVGLSYLNARYYDGGRGQFLSEDPAARDNPDKFLDDPQQLNTYAYARNNPITNTDPNGEQTFSQAQLQSFGQIGIILASIQVLLSLLQSVSTPQVQQAVTQTAKTVGQIVHSVGNSITGGSSGSASGGNVNDPQTSSDSSGTAVSTPITTQSVAIPQAQVGIFDYPSINFSKSGSISGTPRPNNAPTGTKPIDSAGLPRDVIHEVKDSIRARPKDWTGIAPNGDIITGTRDGKTINHGPIDGHTSRPTGRVK